MFSSSLKFSLINSFSFISSAFISLSFLTSMGRAAVIAVSWFWSFSLTHKDLMVMEKLQSFLSTSLAMSGSSPTKAEMDKLLQFGASSSQTPRALTAWLGLTNFNNGALAWIGLNFHGAKAGP